MNQLTDKNLTDKIKRAQKTGLDRNYKFCRIFNLWKANPEDIILSNIIDDMLKDAEMTDLISPDPFRKTNPNSYELPGSIGIGLISPKGIPYTIPPELLTTHLLICGRTGGGKSNLIFLMLSQLMKMNRKAIRIFDRKYEFHALMVYPGFVYWLLADFFTNWIAPPPGIELQIWIPIFCEILGNYLDIRVASRGLLLSKTLWLCKKLNSADTGIYPTLKDVYHLIKNTKYHLLSHFARHQETILNRLDGLIAIFGDHICSHRHMNWDEYISTDWAISLDNIPTDYQNLFMTVEISKIMMYRMTNNQRNNQLTDLFVFDEASTMFKKWYEQRESTYLLTDYLAKAREFGIGFIISTQTLNLADSVLGNTGIKIMIGGSGLGSDYNIFASATGMTKEQREFLKQMTQPGQACVKDPRYPFPFTVEVPRIA